MSKEKIYSADLLIIGGGVAGLTLAKLLGKEGLNIHIVEQKPPLPLSKTQLSSRTVALMQSSLNILRGAGLDDFIEKYGTKMNVMRIIDDSASGQDTITSEFDSFDIGLDYFSMNIPNDFLRARLFEDLNALENIVIHETSLQDLEHSSTSVIANLDNGTKVKAPLLIGADGRKSLVRKISGIKVKKKHYDQSAITCIINHSRSHNNSSTEFHRPGGPFALVPMQGNQSSVVWVEKTEKSNALIALPKEAFEHALQQETNDILGGITLASPPQSWPLCAIKAECLTAPRTALIAEAAHVMSPITAQGLNLSLRDVAALAETIIDALRVGSDHGAKAILKNYERRRSLDIKTRTWGVDSMNQIVRTSKAPIKDLRRNVLKAVDRFGPIRTIAMQHGLAPSLDQGRLTQGESL
ncbi:MAG: FAD-dependent monooxygenase [Alphaproteobacteria bacterium]